MRRWLAGIVGGGILLGLAPETAAADGRKAIVTKLAEGVEVRLQGRGAWRAATVRMVVSSGDELRTGPNGLAELSYGDGTVARLGPNTTLLLSDADSRGLKLWFGRLWLRVAKGSGGLHVRTPAAIAAVTGTDFFVFHEDRQAAASPTRWAASTGFGLASADRVSTIGLLEGGVRVQKASGGFDAARIEAPRLTLASLAGAGFQTAQETGGTLLEPGTKAVADPQLPVIQVLPLSPEEIASNGAILNELTGQPAGSTQQPSGAANADPGEDGATPAGAAPLIPPRLPAAPGQGDGAQPGSTSSSAPPAPPIEPPDPTQTMQDNLSLPIDKSPTTGDLEIIIR